MSEYGDDTIDAVLTGGAVVSLAFCGQAQGWAAAAQLAAVIGQATLQARTAPAVFVYATDVEHLLVWVYSSGRDRHRRLASRAATCRAAAV
ncbi:hypothetical protein ACIBKY_04720 [Nonomuraea sp. NPDC050394]|uniref:hypothetical protein n=1 Tax=Nonomuraea sp. NPDC050394 TaxID=3364363 RepID=UPI0037A93181